MGRDLALPVDRPPHAAHLDADRLHVALGDLERVAAVLDRGVLGGQAERVEAHRPQHGETVTSLEVRDDVTQRVVEDMPHVQAAGRVRQHLEHVEVPLGAAPGSRVVDVEGLLGLPDRLPLLLDCACVVFVHGPLKLSSLEMKKPLDREAGGGYRGGRRVTP